MTLVHSIPYSNHRQLSWVFFDLDDTLTDFSANSLASLDHVYRSFSEINGVFKTFPEFSDVYHSHNTPLWQRHSQGLISSQALRTERWRLTVCPNTTPEISEELCKKIDTEYLHHLCHNATEIEGASELLGYVTKHTLAALITNGFIDTQYLKLEASGLWRFITRTVISEETGIQKPATEIFAYAIRETGSAPSPVFIGDNPTTDIEGALRAGWHAIWFNRFRKISPFNADYFAENGLNPSLYLGEAHNLKEVKTMLKPLIEH